MNALQRFSRELIAAGQATDEPHDTSLVWRGQVIERVAVGGNEAEDAAQLSPSWIDRVVVDD